jgi:hypothetical protein
MAVCWKQASEAKPVQHVVPRVLSRKDDPGGGGMTKTKVLRSSSDFKDRQGANQRAWWPRVRQTWKLNAIQRHAFASLFHKFLIFVSSSKPQSIHPMLAPRVAVVAVLAASSVQAVHELCSPSGLYSADNYTCCLPPFMKVESFY